MSRHNSREAKQKRREARLAKRKPKEPYVPTKPQQDVIDAFENMDTVIKQLRMTPPEGVALARAFERLAMTVDHELVKLNPPKLQVAPPPEAEVLAGPGSDANPGTDVQVQSDLANAATGQTEALPEAS